MFDRIRADIRRLIDGEPDRLTKLGLLFFNLGLHAVLLYRFSHWLSVHHLDAIAVVAGYCNSLLTGAQISPRAKIGKGLVIYHPQGMVIGATSTIGDFCTLTQTNMIGQRYGRNDRPVIGDHFYVGAGAKIMGTIRIGSHVRVGANAVVLESLPDHVTAVGIPARVTQNSKTSD